MFDAKSLIEMMMKGAAGPAHPQQGAAGGLGGLGDLLGQVLGQQGGGGAGRGAEGAAPGGGLGGLSDILGKLGGQMGGQAPSSRAQAAPDAGGLGDLLGKLGGMVGQSGGQASGQGGAPAGGGLEDILRKVQQQAGSSGGNLMDILGQVLGQATSGVKDGAKRIDDATGASGRIGGAVKDATGQSAGDLLEQLKDLIQKNPGTAAAGAGGLGAVVLGTRTGRALAGKAVKLGGLALIGGLAYKALQNYQAGKPLLSGAADIAEAPRGSGFETSAVTQDAAVVYLRAMIAAAAADGRIDANEQQKILGNMKQLGLDAQAEEFLASELNNPATPEQLAQGVSSQEEAVQVFTAARIAVDLDNQEEQQFLVQLAEALGLDGDLVNHIDATARAAA